MSGVQDMIRKLDEYTNMAMPLVFQKLEEKTEQLALRERSDKLTHPTPAATPSANHQTKARH